MKIKIDAPVLDFDGTIIETSGLTKEALLAKPTLSVPLTLRSILEQVLSSQIDGKPSTAEEKIKAYRIGIRLLGKKLVEYDLTTDQIVFLKDRLGQLTSPVVYGRFLELIGDEAVKEE